MAQLAVIEDKDFDYVGEIAFVTDGIHESIDFSDDSGINLISAKSPKDNYFDLTSNYFISEEQHACNERTALKAGDVVISSVGTIGNTSVVDSSILPANADRHVGIIRPKISPYYLGTFLNSKYGRFQSLREATGNVQLNLFIYRIRKLKITKASETLETAIETIVRNAHEKLRESQAIAFTADSLVLEKLKLIGWHPTAENTIVEPFLNSYRETGRLDAEYYHPAKKQMLQYLNKFPGETVGSYATEIDEVINPLNNLESQPVMNFDLNDALPIYLDAKETELTDELGSSKKTFKRGDVVVSRLRSYLKEIAIVDTPENAKTVGSSEFIVLRPSSDQISAEALVVYLRSLPVQLILKWCQSGSNHPRFAAKDLLAIRVPNIVLEFQGSLQTSVRQSIEKSRESKRLLEVAKRAVEIAIEETEGSAMEYINIASSKTLG